MKSVIAQLNKIDTSRVITSEVSGSELLVTLEPVPPAMVNNLIKVRIPPYISSAVVVDKFNEMMKGFFTASIESTIKQTNPKLSGR